MTESTASDVGSLASWVQAGGLALFAGAVFTIVRDQARFIRDIHAMLSVLVDRKEKDDDNVRK